MKNNISQFLRIYLKLIAIAVAVGLFTRVAMLFAGHTPPSGLEALQLAKMVGLGALNDLLTATLGFCVVGLYLFSLSNWKYQKPQAYIILTLLFAVFVYNFFFGARMIDRLGGVFPFVVALALGLWAHLFGLRITHRKVQQRWMQLTFVLVVWLFAVGTVVNGFLEWKYWSLYGVRYDSSLVLGLLYGEGNATLPHLSGVEMGWGVVALAAVTALCYPLFKGELAKINHLKDWRWKCAIAPLFALVVVMSAMALRNLNDEFNSSPRNATLQPHTPTSFEQEFEINGAYKFVNAAVEIAVERNKEE